jgi:hypothetical protein
LAGIAIFVLAMVAMLTGIQEKLGFYQGDMAYAKVNEYGELGTGRGVS